MDLKALFEQIRALYKRLNKKQKIVILATIVAIVGFISALIIWNSNWQYGDKYHRHLQELEYQKST